jgi:threonine dehydratase
MLVLILLFLRMTSKLLSVQNIEQASLRLKGVLQYTPFSINKNLSSKYNANIYLKREDMQVVRSFKIRGAYNKMASMSAEAVSKGVICASAGNHAQGVAFACAHLKIKGTIYMPNTTPSQKITKVRYFGGDWVTINLVGDTFDDAQSAAWKQSIESNLPFIHPFNDFEVMEGQGTVGLEMLRETEVQLDYLIVAVGGGGLMAGVGSIFKHLSPQTKIIAVESDGAPALFEAMKHGKVVKLDNISSFADGIAVKEVGDKTLEICKEVVDDILLIPEGKICSTMLSLYNDEAIVVEPAGAIGISALDYLDPNDIKNKNIAIIVCGGNNDIARTEEIRERALLFEGKKHYFIIRFPQRAGALKDFINLLGPNDDITHFQYTKKNNRDAGPALVGIELKFKEDFHVLIEKMKSNNLNFEHINDRPLLFDILI